MNWFARQLHIQNEPEHIVDEFFIQTKGFPINNNTSERSLRFSMSLNNTVEGILGIIEIPRQELWKLPPDASQAVGIAFPTLGAVLKEAHLENTRLPRLVNGLVLSVILPDRKSVV